MTNPDTRVRFLGFFIVATIGVWFTISMSSAIYFGLASAHWPSVAGVVIASAVDSGTSTFGPWWAPHVEYEYYVAGTKHRSKTVSFVMPILHRSVQADAIVASYLVGQSVDVAFDPDNPDRGVLEPGVPRWTWRWASSALLFWVVVAYLYYDITHPSRRLLTLGRGGGNQEGREESREKLRGTTT